MKLKYDLPQELLNLKYLCKAFANHSSADVKSSKTQTSKLCNLLDFLVLHGVNELVQSSNSPSL